MNSQRSPLFWSLVVLVVLCTGWVQACRLTVMYISTGFLPMLKASSLDVGQYNSAKLASMGIAQSRILIVNIEAGCVVTTFSDPNFSTRIGSLLWTPDTLGAYNPSQLGSFNSLIVNNLVVYENRGCYSSGANSFVQKNFGTVRSVQECAQLAGTANGNFFAIANSNSECWAVTSAAQNSQTNVPGCQLKCASGATCGGDSQYRLFQTTSTTTDVTVTTPSAYDAMGCYASASTSVSLLLHGVLSIDECAILAAKNSMKTFSVVNGISCYAASGLSPYISTCDCSGAWFAALPCNLATSHATYTFRAQVSGKVYTTGPSKTSTPSYIYSSPSNTATLKPSYYM